MTPERDAVDPRELTERVTMAGGALNMALADLRHAHGLAAYCHPVAGIVIARLLAELAELNNETAALAALLEKKV